MQDRDGADGDGGRLRYARCILSAPNPDLDHNGARVRKLQGERKHLTLHNALSEPKQHKMPGSWLEAHQRMRRDLDVADVGHEALAVFQMRCMQHNLLRDG
ncbi:MAG: hypothetical protein R2853_03575 [Thermomicrobiales bacterium]